MWILAWYFIMGYHQVLPSSPMTIFTTYSLFLPSMSHRTLAILYIVPIVKFCDVVYTVTSKVFYWIYAWNRFLLGFFFTGMGGLNYLEKIIPKSYLNLVSQCLASFYRLCFSFPFPCQASVWINKLFKCLWHKDLTHKLFL